MPIVFEPLDSANSVSLTELVLLVSLDARTEAIAAGTSETELLLLLTLEGEADQFVGGDALEPEIPTVADFSLYLSMDGALASHITSVTELDLHLRTEGYFGQHGDSFSETALVLVPEAYTDLAFDNYAFLVERAGVITALSGVFYERLEDRLGLSLDYAYTDTAVMRTRTALGATPISRLASTQRVNERVKFSAVSAIVFRELLQISVALGTTVGVDYRAIAMMADKLLVSGAVSSRLEARALLRSTLLVGSGIYFSWREVLEDSVSLSVEDKNRVTAIEKLIDQAMFEVLDQSTATLRVIMPDTVEFDASVSSFAELASRLQDQIALSLNVFVDNGEYSAWTVNTATSAHTRYTNYPFNSFMQIGSKYYGTSEQGLYRLEGDNDAGVDITAKIRLGLSRLNSGNMKRIQSMYLGYRADGDVLVKVTLADDQTGLRETHVYTLVERGGGSTREVRVPIGRGLQSVYWDFEIQNAKGSDFEVDGLEILPLISERRVRGSGGGK